jgi:hypothetical protein
MIEGGTFRDRPLNAALDSVVKLKQNAPASVSALI